MAVSGIDLEGRVALITGASRGIGAAIACRLAKAGAKVAVNYRSSPEAAAAVVASIGAEGGTAMLADGDVSDAGRRRTRRQKRRGGVGRN